MLYTERFHFYWRYAVADARAAGKAAGADVRGCVPYVLGATRALAEASYKIRGIRNLLFYALPENAGFYPEMLNMLATTDVTCAAVFTPLDLLRLERIVGTDRAKRMVSSDKPLFMFC